MFKDLKIMKTNNTIINSIMKEYKKYLFAALMVLGASVNTFGKNVNYSWTLANSPSDWGSSYNLATKITKGSPAITWTAEWAWSTNSYIGGYQIGSSDYPCTSLKLTTSGLGGTVTNITVNAKIASSGTAKISMKVGGTSVKSATSLTTTATDYTTGSISKTGDIEILITNTAKAFYIYSISFTCSGTEYSVSWSANGESYTTGSPTDAVLGGGKVRALPTNPDDCDEGKTFAGWSASQISGSTSTKPSDLFRFPEDAPAVNDEVTYYAVYGDESVAGADETLFEVTSYSSLPTGWTQSNVGTGTYFDFSTSGGFLTSPLYDPHDNVQVTCSVASNGSGSSHNLIVYILDSSGNIRDSRVTATPSSNTYISSGTLDFGNIGYSFKIRFYLLINAKGVRLQAPKLTGKSRPTYSSYATSCCEKHDAIFGHDGSGNDPDDQSACENISVSFTPDPAEGYEYGGATIYEDDVETQITTLSSSTTSFDMYDRDVYVLVHYVPGNYTITLNNQGATTAGTEEISVTYGSAENLDASPAITVPTKTGYTFGGYWTATGGGGVQVIDASGDVIADVDDGVDFYTSEDKEYFYPGDLTLYANWTINKYKLSIASVDNVVICATTPSLAEGDDPVDVNYGSTVTLSHGDPTGGKTWSGWNAYKTGDTGTPVVVDGNNQFVMPAYDVTVSANLYSDFVFSCAELTLTAHPETEGAPIFITSVAEKKVRSQGYITITGSGLTPSTVLTFPGLNSKFEVLTSTGRTISTDINGAVSENAYIFYTPAAGATTDGLDEIAGITVSVGGAKPKQVSLTQSIIGRHLPTAGYVIAGKKDNKWYALPSDMASTTNPKPSEIAVDDFNNPSVAYTAASNIYGLEGPTTSGGGNNISSGNGQYVRLTMSIDDGTLDPHAAPLFGQSTGSNVIGKSGNSQASSHLSAGWWWALTQTNTSITNPQDAKYTIKCANNTSTLSLRDNAGDPDWGLFASGVEKLRLIPASTVEYTASEVVAWGQKKLILEVAKPDLVTQARAKIGDGSWSAYKSLATTTGTSKGTATKYNYTLDFTSDDFDFAAHEGEMLIVELHNAGGSALKATSVIIPRIVATNTTINKSNYTLKTPWDTEVHVLPGVTLTLDASAYDPQDMTFKELNIYPGATVVAEKGTLKATTLILRNGWDRLSATKKYDVARLYITPTNGSLNATTAYADWYIDFDQYYPIAVPWEVDLGENDGSTICYKNTKTKAIIGLSTTVRLRYYDGASRAKGLGDASKRENWKHYGESGCEDIPDKLEPSKAYAMTAKRPTGKAFSIVRMPLTIPSTTWTTGGEKGEVTVEAVTTYKDQVTVTAYNNDAGNAPEWAKGWNFIANPYMSLYQGPITHSAGSGYNVEYANIPDINFNEYDQYPIGADLTKLKPASGFLIQTEADGTLTFGTTNRKASAPSYRTEEAPQASKQKAYILLSNEEANDMMGLIISDQYTAEYEMNADLEKLLGDGTSLKTYMHYGDMNMAYVAINQLLAQEWIPISVRIPKAGEFTFSLHEASIVGELEGVYLIDYAAGNVITNLLDDNYSFGSAPGTISGRFAINAIVGEHNTPTGIDVINGGGDINSDKPFKFIYHEKVYIYHRGVIYDATGKRVREINK
jgi:uncharacterized repeat protein (TIGR02543 family)